ncbi:MAG: hypothetical protein DCC58_19240, partial [Chloroflexi bacterium]
MLTLLLLAFITGCASYFVGTPDGRGVFWLHRIAGFGLLGLLCWKVPIVVRAYRRRGATVSGALSALLGVLFLSSLVFGLLWSTVGVPGVRLPLLGALTGLGVHVLLACTMLPLLTWHTLARWPRVRGRIADFAGRRALLRYGALSIAGFALWRTSEALAGAERRFTGSRERGSFTGNRFPATNWLSDPKPQVDPALWSLHISGQVRRATRLSHAEFVALPVAQHDAILDCTGGWYTRQFWSGPTLSTLLALVEPMDGAQSIVVRSQTGYSRRFSIDDSSRLLLATHVSGEPLSRGHGFPARLVVPGERGYAWVKWVS